MGMKYKRGREGTVKYIIESAVRDRQAMVNLMASVHGNDSPEVAALQHDIKEFMHIGEQLLRYARGARSPR